MITDEALLEHGYRRYPPMKGQYSIGLFQKAIRDHRGKVLFYIEAHKWCFPDGHQSYEFEGRFYYVATGGFYNILYHPSPNAEDEHVTKIEAWYTSTFQKLDFIPDPNGT